MVAKVIPKIIPRNLDANAKTDPNVATQLDNLYQMIAQLMNQTNNSNLNLFNGQILKELTVTTTNKVFGHSLGREWSGYIVVKNNSSGNFPTYTETLDHDKKTGIELVCAAGTVIVDLYIF